MEVYCTTCYKYVRLMEGGRCPECGNIMANQGSESEGQSDSKERYCIVCKKNVKLVNGGRCPQCGTVVEYQQNDTNLRNITDNFRTAIQNNRNNVSSNSEPNQKTGGMQIWEVIGVIVGLVFVIVGFANATKSSDDFNAIYDPFTKAIYGLYIAIGAGLVIHYSHSFCKK